MSIQNIDMYIQCTNKLTKSSGHLDTTANNSTSAWLKSVGNLDITANSSTRAS